MADDPRVVRVRRQLDAALEEYGAYFKRVAFGHYQALQSTAEVFVDVELDDNGEVLVMVRSPVSYESQLGEAEYRLLLEMNGGMPTAMFGITPENTIFVGQTLFGEHLAPETLFKTVRAVALTGDALDELISAKVGGKRSIDAKPWLKRP